MRDSRKLSNLPKWLKQPASISSSAKEKRSLWGQWVSVWEVTKKSTINKGKLLCRFKLLSSASVRGSRNKVTPLFLVQPVRHAEKWKFSLQTQISFTKDNFYLVFRTSCCFFKSTMTVLYCKYWSLEIGKRNQKYKYWKSRIKS